MSTHHDKAPTLDELAITIVVANATDTLSSIGPGLLRLPEMAYLLGSVPRAGSTKVVTASLGSSTCVWRVTASLHLPRVLEGSGRTRTSTPFSGSADGAQVRKLTDLGLV